MTDLLQDYPDLAILTMDEMSLYFQATLTRVWALKGQTPIVYLSPQRDHIHFYGALDVRNGREIAVTTAEQTSEVTADFIRILLLLFSTQHILLLLDRAPWHKGDAVRQIVAENDRLELLYYPVACPDLNHQEHVWSQVRDQISHNHSYTRFQFLIDDFETYLNQNLFETNFMDKYGLRLILPFLIDLPIRKLRHELRDRSGAGEIPCRRKTVRIVIALTSNPSSRISPSNFSYPRPGLSSATRMIQSFNSPSIGGRPGFLPGLNVHFRRTRSRCQPSRVSGLKSRTHSSSFSRVWVVLSFKRTLIAANGTFCQRGMSGPQVCFRSTIRSCCLSSKISKSFSSSARRLIAARSSTNDHTNNITR